MKVNKNSFLYSFYEDRKSLFILFLLQFPLHLAFWLLLLSIK